MLMLALEPEAASIYCQHLPIQKLHGSSPRFFVMEVGTKYMVVDLGGILINWQWKTHTRTRTQFQQDFVSKHMYVCASPKPKTFISKVICHGIFYVQWIKEKVIVHDHLLILMELLTVHSWNIANVSAKHQSTNQSSNQSINWLYI
jgi:hypothetical protein